MTKPVAASVGGPVSGNDGDEKKKTRIRKKKPKKGNTNAKATPIPTTSPMNPHSVLRNRLVGEGFSVAQVDQAMEEMWDKNLVYDDFQTVLAYLKGEKTVLNDDESKGTTTGEKASEKKDEIDSKTSVGPASVKKAEPDTLEPTAVQKAKSIKAAPTMTLEQRLETVSNFENLTDAIFALTEWINKAAKPRELEDLCAATKTKALVTIFQRSVAETSDQTSFDKSVLPAMVRLMGSLLQRSGISASCASETQNTFETLLRKARGTYLLQQPDAIDFLQRVSRFIVSRISLAIGESNGSAALPVNGSVPCFKASDSTCGLDDSSLAPVLSEREIHMNAAKRYGVMMSSAFTSLAGGERTNGTANGNAITSTEITSSAVSDIMLALVGGDAKAAYEQQKAALEELKSQAKSTESEKAQELCATIDELAAERESVAERILELKKNIEKLQAYDAELCVKVDDTQKQLEKERADTSDEIASLNDRIKEASEALRYGRHVVEVANSLKKYDAVLEKAVAASSKGAPVSNGDMAALAGKQMDIFLSHTLKYFESEAESIVLLKNRITKASGTIDELKMEMVALDGLGLNTTIGQMKETLEKQKALIEKDSVMLQRLKDDAASNFESLMARLAEYKSAQSVTSLQAISFNVLGQIQAVVSNLEVTDAERLDLLIGSMKTSSIPTDSSVPEPAEVISTNSAGPAVPTTLAPTAALKLTWAASKTASNNGDGKLSLVEIQKEELQSKYI